MSPNTDRRMKIVTEYEAFYGKGKGRMEDCNKDKEMGVTVYIPSASK
jgi:hypothetical protein